MIGLVTTLLSCNLNPHCRYPEYCVCKSQPILFPCRRVDTVSSEFFSDISTRFPVFCGQTVSLCKVSVPGVSLHCVTNRSDEKHPQDPISDAEESLQQPKKTTITTEFECADVQQSMSVSTSIYTNNVGVKRLLNSSECTIGTCNKQNATPVLIKANLEPFQTPLSEDFKTNATEEGIKKKVLRSKVSTLKKWLHTNGVHFQCTDKKETLVKLALVHALKKGTFL